MSNENHNYGTANSSSNNLHPNSGIYHHWNIESLINRMFESIDIPTGSKSTNPFLTDNDNLNQYRGNETGITANIRSIIENSEASMVHQ